ncbi:MAG: hypothetical protein JWQ71_967 [Pedosphaera sp.]|nr:hypothetical protein [Pedosphaera sp.]
MVEEHFPIKRMKKSNFLMISLVLNLTLVTAVGYVYKHRSGIAEKNNGPELTDESSAHKARIQKSKSASDEAVVPAKFTWHEVESPDYRAYIARLRAIACPEETIRDIIVADVDKLYAGKIKALRRESNKQSNYWEEKNWYESGGQDTWRQQRALEKEKKALLIALLGVDPQKEKNKLNGVPDYNEQMYSFLPEEKRQVVQDIQERFQDLEQEVYRKYKGYYGEEVQAETREIRKQRKAELAQLLTPYELDEYELRNSNVAQQMQWETRSFNADEQEFRKVFKVKQAFDGQYGSFSPDPDDKEEMKKYQAMQEEMKNQLKSELGEKRYKDYQRSQDWDYQQLDQLTSRAGLAEGTAAKVYDMKDTALDQAKKIRSDNSLTSEERKKALQDVKTTTEEEMKKTLGDSYSKYTSRSGWWIRQLGQ